MVGPVSAPDRLFGSCNQASSRLRRERGIDTSRGSAKRLAHVTVVDSASKTRVIEVASPPRDAKSITRLPGISWKKFLRDLKAGDIKQVCLIANADSLDDASSRPKSVEPKSAREERFAAQSWETLKASGNPVST
ncbi:Polyprotein [Phytophthora palmivora]|uniref:Polyprotein n=1 Tax=Phytophthora palmivora TaxID=4796 RepID=A0A2P4YLA4_9STRA|nr:Polyprotein [Phytophthora palmivora]